MPKFGHNKTTMGKTESMYDGDDVDITDHQIARTESYPARTIEDKQWNVQIHVKVV